MISILFSAYSDNVDIYIFFFDNSYCGLYEPLEFHKGVVIYKIYETIIILTNYLYLSLSILNLFLINQRIFLLYLGQKKRLLVTRSYARINVV